MYAPHKSRFIYITGCDGTGKTTQAQLLVGQLKARGVKTRRVWLRFPFFFSASLLAYARLRGYSWHEETHGVKIGYWDFRRSWAMRRVFPWLLLLDAALLGLWHIYLPLWLGYTLVCERFTLDMLVDLRVACDDPEIPVRLPGRLYLRLLPIRTQLVILDLDVTTLQNRRADLSYDNRLVGRLEAFRTLARRIKISTLSSALPIAEVNRQILQIAIGSHV